VIDFLVMAKLTKAKRSVTIKPAGKKKPVAKKAAKKAVQKTKVTAVRKAAPSKTISKKVAGKAVKKKASSPKKAAAAPKVAVAKKITKKAPQKVVAKVKAKVVAKVRKAPAAKETHSPEPSTLSGDVFPRAPRRAKRGTGSEYGGQSGDLQGLSRREDVDSESVEELVAEGQYREAEIVGAVEDALDPDEGEVRTREFPEDDVPEEYIDTDEME
jgi:hypothetical protein